MNIQVFRNHFWRNALTLSLALSIACLATGCRKTAEKDGAAGPKVALVMKSLANEFFNTMAEGARRHQATNASPYSLIVNGTKNDTALAEQDNLVNKMIARQMRAIYIATDA